MAALKYRVNGEWHTLPTGVSYEVGDIFISTNATSPAARFGGTWTQLTDRFLVGAGNSYGVGSTGGESSITLTQAQLPEVYGDIGFFSSGNKYGGISDVAGAFSVIQTSDGAGAFTSSTATGTKGRAARFKFGKNQAHNNMPPYLAVYMWLRTA